MNEKKFGKYLNKILQCIEEKKMDLYYNKLCYYKNNYSQSGGTHDNLITMLNSYVDDIINKHYRLLTDDRFFVKNTNDCLMTNDFFTEDDSAKYEYGIDLAFYCFRKQLNPPDDYSIMESIYNFKKSFSLDLTDFYVNSVSIEDNTKIVNFLHFSLELAINTYIEKIISSRTFGNKSDNIIDNVYILYKGGNTTRMYVNKLIETILPRLRNSPTSNKAKEILYTIKKEYKIGDWDFQIFIDYDKLREHRFTEPELELITAHILQVCTVTLSYIKPHIELFLRSTDNINKLSNKLQNYYFNSDMQDKINKNIEILNRVANRKIDYLKIDTIYIFDKVIDNNNIVELTNDEIIDRNSFVYFSVNNPPLTIGTNRYANNTLAEVNNFYFNQINKFLPDYLKKTMVYISLLKDIVLIRGAMPISNFHLLRCKINTVFEFSVIYNDLPESTMKKNKRFPVELIDVSVPTKKDTRSIFSQKFKYRDYVPTTEINILQSFGQPLITKIPSPQYMFSDLSSMILGDPLFSWDDRKYAKRINRLLYIIIICLITEKRSIPEIRAIFSSINNLFINIKKLPTIDQKLQYLEAHFDIIRDPNNDVINNTMNELLTRRVVFNVMRVSLKYTSPYKNLKYFHHIIEKYIEMLIIGHYIINNVSKYYNYIQSKLIFPYLIDNREQFFNINVSISTRGLSDIYKKIRGTPINITAIPNGPIPGLPPPDSKHITDFVQEFLEFEDNIINLTNNFIVIIDGLIDSGINSLDLNFDFNALF